MPMATHATDPLDAYREGARDATHHRPIPLVATAIDVTVQGLFATVRTRRVFRNAEDASIEATMTYPVPVDAVAHDLRVEIDGRALVGKAEPNEAARETYEAALDAGKAAVLHEEALKGVHVLSIAHIPPGREVAVEISWSKPLLLHGATPSLRIPTTVAQIYGRLPLLPADDLIVDDTRVFEAKLGVATDAGVARLGGRVLESGQTITVPLDRPIDLAFTGLAPRDVQGVAADGRRVTLAFDKTGVAGDGALRLGVLFDRSGSTGEPMDGYGAPGLDTWHAAMDGLRNAFAGSAGAEDAFEVFQFDSVVEHVGAAKGAAVTGVLDRIGGPRGGTEAGLALAAAVECEAITDILLITDGRTGAIPVQSFAACGKRISAVLCGANSLDAMVGHLCALTGGQVVVAASDNIAAAIAAVVAAARAPTDAESPRGLTALPRELSTVRAASRVRANWSPAADAAPLVDAVGAYAAALALPTMTEEAATEIAVAHGLCTHLTSLVVVDETGETQEGLPNQRKVPLSAPIEAGRMYLRAPPAAVRSREAPMAPCPPPAACAAPMPAPVERAPMPVQASAPPPAAVPRTPVQARPSAPPPAPAPRDGGERGVMPMLRRLWPQPAAPGGTLRRIAAGLDWDGDANALSTGDIASIASHDRRLVKAAAREPRIVELAKGASLTPEALVIALMAATVAGKSRGAGRIARLLAALSDAHIAEAEALLGL